jgi:hypothetical protein
MGVVVRRDDVCGMTVNGDDGSGWSSDGVVLWLGRRQNRDTIEWWREWSNLRWHFYSSGGWKLGWPGRVAGGSGTDLMFRFRLEIRRWQNEVLSEDEADAASSSCLHGKEAWHCAAAWWRRSEERRHRGGKRLEKTPVELTQILLVWKIKKIHTIDSVATNRRWRFQQWVNLKFLKIYASEI